MLIARTTDGRIITAHREEDDIVALEIRDNLASEKPTDTLKLPGYEADDLIRAIEFTEGMGSNE